MPPRLAFALSRGYAPDYEAISREIAALRPSDAAVLGLMPLAGPPWHHRLDRNVLEAHPLAMRAHPWAARMLRDCDVSHAFAPLPLPRRMRWLPRARREVLTAVSVPTRPDPASLARYDRIVVECERDLRRLREVGVAADRLRCIEPFAEPVDLPLPAEPFRAGFASWPFRPDEAAARGLDLIADAARALPEMRFRVLLRPGSRVDSSAFDQLHNVEIVDEILDGPAEMWREVHVALAVFRGDAKSKSAPNSILEAIAAGRPAIVGEAVGIAGELAASGAGLAIPPRVDELCAALRAMRTEINFRRDAALTLRARYSIERYRAAYAELYDELV